MTGRFPRDPGLVVTLYSPEPTTPSADAMILLVAWATTHLNDDTAPAATSDQDQRNTVQWGTRVHAVALVSWQTGWVSTSLPAEVPRIETSSLVLRAFCDDDVPLIQQAATDQVIPHITTAPTESSPQAARALLARQYDRLHHRKSRMRTVVRCE